MTTNVSDTEQEERTDAHVEVGTGTADLDESTAADQQAADGEGEGGPLPVGGKPVVKPDNWSNP